MYPAGVSTVRTRTITLGSGLCLRVVESGAGQGTPLVLIHGWGACVYTFRHLLSDSRLTSRRILAFDLRGHGLSDKPVGPGRYTTPQLLDDFRDLLDTLHLERVDLLGHSLGGGAALHFALAHPTRIRRLALAAPVGLTSLRLPTIGHLLAPRFTDRFARFLAPRWLTNLLLRSTYGDPRRVTEHDVDEYWAPSQFPDYFRAARALLEEFDWRPLTVAELAEVRCETLVILSTADRLIRDAESAAQQIPRARVIQLNGAGHLGIEECAGEFNRALAAFLSAPEA